MTDSPAHRHRWLVLIAVLSAEIMDLLDSTITSVAAPTIRFDLGGSASLVQWLGAAYTIPFASLLICGGRLGDLVARRSLFITGALGFTVASIGCAFADSPATLIGARVVQGTFAALLVPQGFGLVKSVFPREQLRAAYAAFGPALGLAAVCGPILGGLLAGTDILGLTWRTVFLVTVPIGLFAAVVAISVVPRGMPNLVLVPAVARATTARRGSGRRARVPRGAHRRSGAGRRLDLIGTAMVTAGAVGIVFPIVQGQQLGWPWWGFAIMAGAVVLFAAMPLWARRSRAVPLIEPSLLRNPAFASGMAVTLFFIAAFTGLTLVVSLFCQLGLGFSAVRTGLTVGPLAFGIALTSPVGASLAATKGRTVLQTGLVIAALGCGGAALTVWQVGLDTTTWWLLPPLVVGGCGVGLVFPPLFDVVLAGVTEQETGSASGVLNSMQQFATSIGVAVLAAVYLDVHLPTHAFVWAALGSAGSFVVAGLLSVRLPLAAIVPDELDDADGADAPPELVGAAA